MKFLIFLLLISVPMEKKKPETLKPKVISSSKTDKNTSCVKETNPCGTEINNKNFKCCPGLKCYEEKKCIDPDMYKILKHYNITFGNCYNETLIDKIMNTNYTKSNNTRKIKIIRNEKTKRKN